MTTSCLSPAWNRWRHRRREELLADGVKADIAREFALREAHGRARIASLVGNELAMRGTLVMREEPSDTGQPSWFLHFDDADRTKIAEQLRRRNAAKAFTGLMREMLH